MKRFHLIENSDVEATIGLMDASTLRDMHNIAFAEGKDSVVYHHPLLNTHVARMTMEDSIASWAKLYANPESITIILKTEEISNHFIQTVGEKLQVKVAPPLPRDAVAMNVIYKLLTRNDNEALDKLIECIDDGEKYTARAGDIMHIMQVNKTVNLINQIVTHCDNKITELKLQLEEENNGTGTSEV